MKAGVWVRKNVCQRDGKIDSLAKAATFYDYDAIYKWYYGKSCGSSNTILSGNGCAIVNKQCDRN